MSNGSWFFRVFNEGDQYAAARQVMSEIQRSLKLDEGTKPYAYIAIGHSLGGGLAQHVAAAFPCVAAVVFDTSPVTNVYLLERPFRHQLVSIYENADPLTKLAHFLFPYDDYMVTGDFQYYKVNVLEQQRDQHDIVRLTTALARKAICCQLAGELSGAYDATCQIPRSSQTARQLWCQTMPEEWRVNDGGLCSGPATLPKNCAKGPDLQNLMPDFRAD